MTALQVYAILNKKINGVASGVASHRVEGTDLILTFTDGTSATISFPTPKDGLSAYEIAKNNGFVGTEKEWLDSLQGETPHIDPITKHWIIGDVDTGVVAEGKSGTGGTGNLFFLEKSLFPLIGEAEALYVATDEDILYYWNTQKSEYRNLGGSSFLGEEATPEDIDKMFGEDSTMSIGGTVVDEVILPSSDSEGIVVDEVWII